MKKILSFIILFTLLFTSTLSSFAGTNNTEVTYENLIDSISSYLEITSNGLVNVEQTIINISDSYCSSKDLAILQKDLNVINNILQKFDATIDSEGIIRSNNNTSLLAKNNLYSPFLSDGNFYIREGMYLTENNYIRVYFTAAQAQEMINNRTKFELEGWLVGTIVGYLNAPLGALLSLINLVSSQEADQISSALSQSNNYGVCLYYWRYGTSRYWSPWYEGSVVGDNWEKLN